MRVPAGVGQSQHVRVGGQLQQAVHLLLGRQPRVGQRGAARRSWSGRRRAAASHAATISLSLRCGESVSSWWTPAAGWSPRSRPRACRTQRRACSAVLLRLPLLRLHVPAQNFAASRRAATASGAPSTASMTAETAERQSHEADLGAVRRAVAALLQQLSDEQVGGGGRLLQTPLGQLGFQPGAAQQQAGRQRRRRRAAPRHVLVQHAPRADQVPAARQRRLTAQQLVLGGEAAVGRRQSRRAGGSESPGSWPM